MPSRDVKPLVSLHLIFNGQTLKHCLSLTWTLCCCRATCSGDSLDTNSCTCCLLSSSWASSLESPPPPSDNRSRSSRSAEVGAATPSLLTELSWAQWKIILFVLKGFLQIFYTCSMDILSLYNEMYIKALKISMIIGVSGSFLRGSNNFILPKFNPFLPKFLPARGAICSAKQQYLTFLPRCPVKLFC